VRVARSSRGVVPQGSLFMLLSLERFVDQPQNAGHDTKRCRIREDSALWSWVREACSDGAKSSFLLTTIPLYNTLSD
jgi:hypothetical protein